MRAPLVALRLLAVGILLLAAVPATAVRSPEPGSILPDLDARLSRNARYQAAVAMRNGVKLSELLAGPVAEPGPIREAALAELVRASGPVEVRWDQVTGSPRLLFARHGFLSPPDARPHEAIARDFLLRHRELFLLSADQVKDLRLSRLVPTSSGGSVVRLEQSIRGVDVLHGHLAVSVTGEGRVLHLMGGQVSGAGSLASAVPRSEPAQALRVMASMAGADLAQMPAPVCADQDGATFRVKELRGPVTVRTTIVPTAGGPRLAWTAALALADRAASYETTVDDATLQPIRRVATTWHLDTRGRVFFNNPTDSTHDVVRFVDSEDYRRDQSPSGWTDAAAATPVTAGNNVVVQDDIANDDETTPGAQAAAAGPAPWWAFDHPFTTGGAADADASLTALFYGINFSHDRFHDLGFDEPSGNFQVQNFGRGGAGGDPVLGDDMDGSGTNNANFQTNPDGVPSRMQMYLWDVSGTPRSSSFETGIVVHEFGHGVSTRLVGGPDDVDCLFGFQSGSMGEAWSDYFAASFLEDTVIAEWVAGDPAGIRMFRLDENPPTGKDYRDFCTYGSDRPPQLCEVHDNGEMWSGLLWLVRERYVAIHGAVDGARMADQLVIDALKYTICEPSMLDARDALILADRLSGGHMECEIKTIAAARWMGFDAASTGGSDTEPVPGNAPWPECVDRGVVRFDREGLDASAARATYGCDDQVLVLLTDANFVPAADEITVIVDRGGTEVDRELLSPSAGDGVAAFNAAIRTSLLPGAPGDGVLQVQPGDQLIASYADLAPGGSISTATADVSCTARLRVVRHHVQAGSCDADAVPGYPELPGFVDAGETADLVVELANLAPMEVQGLLIVRSDNPNLTILPSAPLPVTFPPAIGTSPASLTLRLKAVGSLAISAGELANVTFEVQSAAFTPGIAATLPLELHLDYEIEAGLSATFDIEGETAPAGPDWTRGELVPGGGNQWTVVTCDNTTPAGTRAFRNGPAGCSNRYSDAQGNPWIASPALSLFDAQTRAARVTQAEWQNKINLGVIGFPPNIPLAVDADAVVVMLTNDPGVFDASDPISIATGSLAFYIRVDIPGFYSQDSNTTDWVLDQRAVLPGQFSGVDFSQPAHLAWYFLPDITFVQPPLDAQGTGYYLDDVMVTYERVRAVPQAAACIPTVAPYALAFISDPSIGAACAGSLITVDASASEVALCGPPAILEYRFLKGGTPVACFETNGTTPRAQDVDGWGTSATCSETIAADAAYGVEVRCQSAPLPTDSGSASVRIVDGLPLVTGSAQAFCAGSGDTIRLDARASSLVGCPGAAEYEYSTAAGPLDCDGDTVPDGFRENPFCDVGPSDVPLDITLRLRCAALPGCELVETFTIPAVSATAVAAEASTPPGGYYCEGSMVTLDGSGSVVTGCAGGVPQYRWRSVAGYDSGWTTSTSVDVPVVADTDFSLEVRCSLNPGCVSVPDGPVSALVRTGAFVLSQSNQPTDCPGDLFGLVGGVRNPPGVRCAGTVEYRFLQQQPGPVLVPLACFTDSTGATLRTQDVDGWGSQPACWTPQIAGGADFVAEYRCGDDPSCTLETSLPRRIVPATGVPTGSSTGTLRVRKTAGCPAGGDVLLAWGDTDFSPLAFIVYRSDDLPMDPVTDRLALVDDLAHADAGVACDGGGVPYRGATVYFYLHVGRNTCTDEPLP